MSRNDEFCIKNEVVCIKNEDLCIKNDEFVSNMINLAGLPVSPRRCSR